MAIVWGAAKGNFRLGIDLIDNGSSFTWIVYGESVAYGHNWSYTLSFSGSTGGSVTGSFYSGYGQTVRRELHRWNSPKQTYSVTATLNSALVSGATVSRGITVTPKPAAPRIDRVVRNSDSSHRVEWTRYATYTSVRLERRTNGGAWQHVSTVNSNAANITDTTTKAGNRYQYRVRGSNAGGTSDWSNLSSVVYTTPPAPTGVTATRVGDDIRVNGTVHANASHVDIQDDGTTVVSALAKGSLPWTHSSPSQVVTHRYRMRARVASGAEGNATLYSAWSAYSATVQLTAPPSAPTGLNPNGLTVESGSQVSLSWKHSPVDSSEQTAYELRHRVDAGAWTTLSGTTASSRSLTVGAGVVEWQVRTKGTHPDWSPWSAVATVTVVDKPMVSILSPDEGQFFEAVLPVTWSFFQGQGRPQSAWRAQLLRDGQLLETKQGTGSASSTTFSHRLEDGYSYTVEVDAASGSIWSAVESVTVDASFILPAPAVLEGVWNDSTGAVDLQVSVLEQTPHADVINYAPRIQGSGTWAEVRRNVNTLSRRSQNWSKASSRTLTPVSDSRFRSDVMLAEGTGWVVCGTYTVEAGDIRTVSVRHTTPTGLPPTRSWAYFANVTAGISGDTTEGYIDHGDGTFTSWATRDFTGAGSFQMPVMEFNLSATGVLIGDPMVETVPGPPKGFFDGAVADFTVDPDMRTRWLGEENASESVMEIERVAGLTGANAIAGVSTWAGKPAVRIIPTGGANNSLAQFTVSSAARATGTLIGTSHVAHPLAGSVNANPRNLTVYSPLFRTAVPVDPSGDYAQRLTWDTALTSNYVAELRHGGSRGSGDVWWTDIGLFAGDYQGDYFDGDTEWVLIDGVWMHTRWNPDGTSTASMPDTAVSMTVERSIDGGNTWAPVLVDESGLVQVADHEALSNGVTIYRVTTYAATGAATVREYPVSADSEAVWIGGGVGHAVTARLPYSPQITVSGGRERTMFRFSGRPKPVVYAGEGISRVVDSNGMILVDDAENTQPDDLILVAQNEEPTHLYRDPDGRHVTGMLTDIQVARKSHAHWAYSFQLEESED